MAAASRKRKRPAAAAAIKERVFAGGETLRSRMASSQGPLPEAEVRAYMRQLLRATRRAHDAGLVHGDITPDSILVSPSGGAVHLPGFSALPPPVRPQPVGPDGYPHLRTTMQYRSPELLNYVPCLRIREGPAADAFALGCVMYELVAGKRLFTADTPEELFEEAEELHDSLIELEEGYDGMGLGDLSQHGKEVISGLLQFHNCDRLTAADALEHPWFTESSRRKTKTRRTQTAPVQEDASVFEPWF